MAVAGFFFFSLSRGQGAERECATSSGMQKFSMCIQYVWNWFGYFISQDFTVQTRVRIEYLHPLEVIVTQSSQLERVLDDSSISNPKVGSS